MNKLDQLGSVEIFKGLDQQQLDAVTDCCRIITINEGEKLFGDGEDATFLWAVIEGGVDLRFDLPGGASSKETTVATLSSGKVFGWSSFVPPFKYRLSGYCSSKGCKLIEIRKDCLKKVFETNALIGYRVMTNVSVVIGTRFQQLQNEIAVCEGEILLHQKDN